MQVGRILWRWVIEWAKISHATVQLSCLTLNDYPFVQLLWGSAYFRGRQHLRLLWSLPSWLQGEPDEQCATTRSPRWISGLLVSHPWIWILTLDAVKVHQLCISGFPLHLFCDASIRANSPDVLEMICCINPWVTFRYMTARTMTTRTIIVGNTVSEATMCILEVQSAKCFQYHTLSPNHRYQHQ